MRRPCLLAVIATLVVVFDGNTVSGQPIVADETPRASWGDPDLQGTWTTAESWGVPLERGRPDWPPGARRPSDERVLAQVGINIGVGFADSTERRKGKGLNRPSLIVDPPEGGVPPLTPAAQQRAEARSDARYRRSKTGSWDGPTDSWEDRNAWERCITLGMPGHMLPRSYNSNYQILQAPGYVVILYEMIHDARIIPLGDRPHLGTSIRQWLGDPRGRWDGDTLVVETTNFNDKLIPRPIDKYGPDLMVLGAGHNGRLIERFTRVDRDVINYQFTIEDPSEFTRSWTAAYRLTKTDDQIYEYACHEGNKGLPNILSAARTEDKGR